MFSASQAVLEDAVRQAIAALGLGAQASSDVLLQILESLAKPSEPDFNPEQFVTKLTVEQGREKMKTASRDDLEHWFLHYFPNGAPRGLTDAGLRIYIGAAVTKEKGIRGNCP